MATAIDKLMNQARAARRETRLAEAHRDFDEAVKISRAEGSRLELIEALKGLGQIERDLGQVERARPIYAEADELCRQDGDGLRLARSVRHLGDIHQDLGKLQCAESCDQKALVLYREAEQVEPLDLANAIRPLAMLLEKTARIPEAFSLWKPARELDERAQVDAGVKECSARMASLSGSQRLETRSKRDRQRAARGNLRSPFEMVLKP